MNFGETIENQPLLNENDSSSSSEEEQKKLNGRQKLQPLNTDLHYDSNNLQSIESHSDSSTSNTPNPYSFITTPISARFVNKPMKAYMRRWWILIVFSLQNFINATLWISFSPIQPLAIQYYSHSTAFLINLLSISYMQVALQKEKRKIDN